MRTVRRVAKARVFSQSMSYGLEVAMSSVESDIASGRIPNRRASHSGTLSRAGVLTRRSLAILTRARVETASSSSSSVTSDLSTTARQ